MTYKEVPINLTPAQRQSIARAVSAGSSVKLKFTNKQLFSHNATVHLTNLQYNRLQKAKRSGHGVMITLSKKQLDYHKRGGFLPILLGSLISAGLPWLLNKVFPDKQEGQGINENYKYKKNEKSLTIHPETHDMNAYGINLPGGHGINLPGGSGVLLPANGENTQYHLAGNHSSYLPDNNQYGNGYVLPGTTMKQPRQKALGIPKNYRRGAGILSSPYIHPNSENIQYLK